MTNYIPPEFADIYKELKQKADAAGKKDRFAFTALKDGVTFSFWYADGKEWFEAYKILVMYNEP